MQLPKDLLTNVYTKPKIFLCDPDKTIIGQLQTYNTVGDFKFNTVSEISFEVDRYYNDTFEGKNKLNPYYDKVEAFRLLKIEGFGFFELQAPKLTTNGIQETKAVTAYSLERTMAQKYLTNFKINTGEVDSLEVIYAESQRSAENPNPPLIPITLYNPSVPELSLLHLALEKVYGWHIDHVDPVIANANRTFSITRQSVYDFLVNEIADKFNCYFVFDTFENKISIYSESQVERFIGDGLHYEFIINPPFKAVDTVRIDGYETIEYRYNGETGKLSFMSPLNAPYAGAIIEVTDSSSMSWTTDVMVSFDNLANKIDVNYNADDIKTVLNVKYGNDNDIRAINLGLPYITDISYFFNKDRMGEELFNKYTAYQEVVNTANYIYIETMKSMNYLINEMEYEKYRQSLRYIPATTVTPQTVGKYYVAHEHSVDKGEEPIHDSQYYIEVTLPIDYDAYKTYYKMDAVLLTEESVNKLFAVLQEYFLTDTAQAENEWAEHYNELESRFSFVATEFWNLKNVLKTYTQNKLKQTAVKEAIKEFLSILWKELGMIPLNDQYLTSFREVQAVGLTAGWAVEPTFEGDKITGGDDYPYYYPILMFIETLQDAIAERNAQIEKYQKRYDDYKKDIDEYIKAIDMHNPEYGFTDKDFMRINSFLREDELQVDNIVESDTDTEVDIERNKVRAMEAGRIALNKICQPKFSFSLDMANIYAIEEMKPLVRQFQLGNMIRVKIRDNYIRQSRLIGVKLNFDNFADFSVSFGDLLGLRTQSDIHADLLGQAIQAGQQVAENSANWSQGVANINKLTENIQSGLLDTVNALKSNTEVQRCYMDRYGLHLEGENDDGKKVWMVNDKIVFTNDNFNTAKSVLGEYTINGEKRWGLITEYVDAGVVNGSEINGSNMTGGTIQIGEYIKDGKKDYYFKVDKNGNVTMSGGGSGITKEQAEELIQDAIKDIDTKGRYFIEIQSQGNTVITEEEQRVILNCKVYQWSTDVTDEILDSQFKWKRHSSNSELDDDWAAIPAHQNTKTITIGPFDVIGDCFFYCEVDLPEGGIKEGDM